MATMPNVFTVLDYVVFVISLIVSMGIGIYFAIMGDRQRTQGEYLMGGRTMPLIPVAISLLVSFMSAITMLGTPAEIYRQGTEWFVGSAGMGLGFLIAGIFYVPLLYPLGLTSAYEYLERRFHSRTVRIMGMLVFCYGQILYMGIASYAPATALEAVTGIPVWATVLVAGLVTTFYTTIGGMKAVVWTDVFQAAVIFAGILSIVIKGTINVGGFSRVWEVNQDWERVHFFTLSLDPRVRHTTWGMTIGNAMAWMSTAGFTQAAVQRYCSLPTLNQARMSVLINVAGVILLYGLACYSGFVMFAYYAAQNCDPLEENLVNNPNQLIPYFVMEILAYPGVPGLFIASLFSGALSSMSSSMNSLAAIIWEDALKSKLDDSLNEYNKTVVLKVLVAIFGVFSILVGIGASFRKGTVVETAQSLLGPSFGTLAGLFLLGALFPCANKYGAMAGSISGLVISTWKALGSMITKINANYLDLPSPNGTCSAETTNSTILYESNTSTTALSESYESDLFITTALEEFYSISYMWIASMAIVTCIVIGLLVSVLTHRLIPEKERQVPTIYQIPIFSRMCCCFPSSWLYYLNCCRSFNKLENTPNRNSMEMTEPTSVIKIVITDTDLGYSYQEPMAYHNGGYIAEETPEEVRMRHISRLFDNGSINKSRLGIF